MDRRVILRLLGATAVGGLAGCATQDGATGPTSPSTDSPTETDTSTPTEIATTEPMTDTTQPADTGLVTVTADDTVEATVQRITTDIEETPLNLVTTIDHAANAANADMDLPPTTLLVFGNPAVGTPLMRSSRTVAIDLPQKMLVWEDDDGTKIAYNDPTYLAERHGIDDQTDRLEQIRSVLNRLATGG